MLERVQPRNSQLLFVTDKTQLNAAHAQSLEKLRPIAFIEPCPFLTIQSLEFQEIWQKKLIRNQGLLQMVISSPNHQILGTRLYSPFTFVLSKNVFCQGMVVLLNPVCVLLSVECFMFIRAP